jgi:hypothetical protein
MAGEKMIWILIGVGVIALAVFGIWITPVDPKTGIKMEPG